MRDYFSIGSTPYEEGCLQTGKCSSLEQKVECRIFLRQIERYYPVPEGGVLLVKGNPHDFGTYYEVNTAFDPDNEDQLNWALAVESDDKDQLATWDDQAHEEIKQYMASGNLPKDYYNVVM